MTPTSRVAVVCGFAFVVAAYVSRSSPTGRIVEARSLTAEVIRLAPQDTWIGLNSTNFSSGTLLRTYTWPDYRAANAILMTFDLSSLPPGAIVEQATLHLALVQADGQPDSTYTVAAHKVLRKPTIIADATGYTADGVTAWTANHCCDNSVPLAQSDISAAYDSRAIDKAPGFKSWTITTMVQEWLADAASNRGLLLNADASTPRDRYRYFASMQHADVALRPFLEIRYLRTSIDTSAPIVSMSAPKTGAAVSGSTWLEAQASDDVGVTGVQFVLDGVPIGAEVATPPYTIAWDTTAVSDGMHVLAAIARDAADHRTISGSTTVAVANGVFRLSPQDTWIGLDSTNYSADPLLRTYTWPDYQTANAILMKFDLTRLPAALVVEEATLHLALVQSDGQPEKTYTVAAHKLLGKPTTVAEATGYLADGVTPWTPSARCYNSVPLAQADISAAYDSQAIDKASGVKSWTVTSMVQEWLADPTTNFGVLLNSDASKPADRYRSFASVEYPRAQLRPFLRIAYSIPAANAQLMLEWDRKPETNIVGYKVYVGESSRTYTARFNVGNNTSYTITGLYAGRIYYFAVTAYDTSGNESDFSAEISTTVGQ